MLVDTGGERGTTERAALSALQHHVLAPGGAPDAVDLVAFPAVPTSIDAFAMTDPETTRPFAPAELDAIEDALEQLHGEDAFVVGALPGDGDAIVRERLASYRAISRLSRDVLRSYEAPAHVLERVVALARESAVPVPTANEPAAAAPLRASLWQRMRGAWTIPLFATAVAAAVVAIVVVPMTQRGSERATDVVAANEPAPMAGEAAPPASQGAPTQGADKRLAMAEPPPPDADSLAGLRGDAVLEESAAQEQDARAAEGRFAAESESRREKLATRSRPNDDAIAAGPKDTPTPSPQSPAAKPKTDAASVPKGAGSGGAPGAPPATTTPTKNDERKQEIDELARADAARRSGDCTSAVKLYESVRKSGTKKQRARALVGLALCAERDGEKDRAADLLAKARADDADIDAYYDSQR